MKRVVLDGNLVINVECVAPNATGPNLWPDDTWVGPGCIWDEATGTFQMPPDEPEAG